MLAWVLSLPWLIVLASIFGLIILLGAALVWLADRSLTPEPQRVDVMFVERRRS